ncbi:cyclophilin family peptidyl-prolyl cis-trans isomerase [Arenibacter algicola]|uniref:Peptidyl-prolyl cis-trans isomerase n=1 Tax=Arenibacter algicola TaxID=616991 RepID=A0A221UYR4_9FLAO|nr:peptidylprolyl isomerase [Arenibacter algicola]ASO06246.1 peptidyl-prolyl cis-trans isomerase B [Arenibacter algicola]|tara:strand:+ start:12866 stop:13591 length:726 start_codon:yes stop_codon:yes gene_type:complete|eukprot:TRINITY_DN2645_c0_g3_i1.p2 TRINITY_DN2645_c0_g3~~TRINITY_DN2645_c0_g3_i1.p2  ORF type:complete len:242 (-),score=52.96 TRINITY_DN2645_c0_g3_i1:431-1156(-)
MTFKEISLFAILFIFLLGSCKDQPTNKENELPQNNIKKDSIVPEVLPKVEEEEKEEEKAFELTEDNSIEFFFNYSKTLKENKVKLTTSLGDITIELFDNVPYHKANFIYLTKMGYFNNTYFHRVVKNFIIQGGNADNVETAEKRSKIGRYLLPPDTRKGHKHHRGVVSMPSSEINNPHKLASPYEFFIVVTKPGSYHLDGGYTPFGQVIDGMDVVDKINSQPVDNGDWPSQNIYILKAEAF